MFEQVTILGPGLLGASIAMAVKARGLTVRVHTWSRRESTRAKCAEQSWCDAVFDTAEASVEGSDLVIVCTPVETIVPLLSSVKGALRPDSLVTDVGSTKRQICESMAKVFAEAGPAFVGSHPMAGSDLGGMEHAQVDLLQDAACIVVGQDGQSEAAQRVVEFWDRMGMRTYQMTGKAHDEVVAHVSHLPHLLASSLCSYVSQKSPDAEWLKLSGGGFRDTTRVAGGDAELWRQILIGNREQVIASIEGFEAELGQFKAALQAGRPDVLKALLENGRQYRSQL